jgi:uncharacterized protein YbjQ (UPF0145 family)
MKILLMSKEICPNCGKALTGLFATNSLIPQSKIDFINKNQEKKSESYCTNCSKPILDQIAQSFRKERNSIQKRLEDIINYLPMLTTNVPNSWECEYIGMYSAHTTSGSGFATDLSRSFNDFFGTTSNTSNQKIANALKRCKSELRVKCIKAGGNAIIGASIHYNEVGTGSTNMIMIAVTGTVVKITNIDQINLKSKECISEILELAEQLEAIAEFPS